MKNKIASIKIINDRIIKERYPIVIKFNEGNMVAIIYSNHSEFFKISNKYNGCKEFKYDGNKEIENLLNNGGRIVHNSSKETRKI